jgi:hypothetical protein
MNAATGSTELVWYQPARTERRFELRRDQEVLATLRFAPASAVSWGLTNRHVASVEAVNARWQLSVTRHGFLGLKGRIFVEGTSGGAIEAGFFLLKGTLQIAHEADLRWVGGLARNSSDRFEDIDGRLVLRLDHGSFAEQINARVTVAPTTAAGEPIALLASLGLYMRLLMNKVYR